MTENDGNGPACRVRFVSRKSTEEPVRQDWKECTKRGTNREIWSEAHVISNDQIFSRGIETCVRDQIQEKGTRENKIKKFCENTFANL
jgi:hypothetical protein